MTTFRNLGIALTVIACTATGAHAQEKWSIATSSSGSGPYIVGSAIAKTINAAQDKVVVSAQTSGGYNNNLVLVAEGKANVGLTFLSDLVDAHAGAGSFAELPAGMFDDLNRLFAATLTTVHCVVPATSPIQNFTDLKGYKVNINVPATSTSRANKAIIDAFGMSIDDFTPFEIATSKSYDALADGIVDATCNFQPVPSSSIQQLAATIPVRVLPMSQEIMDKVNASYSGTMVPITIPAGTYTGQDSEVQTFAAPEVLFAHADADPELVRAFAEGYWTGAQPTTAGFGALTLQDAALDLTVPIHPGMAAFLKEQGLLN